MPDVSASSNMKAMSADEMRMRNYRAQVEARHEAEMREIELHNTDDVVKAQTADHEQMEQIKGAYDVEISKEAESLEGHLHDIREQNQERIPSKRNPETTKSQRFAWRISRKSLSTRKRRTPSWKH